MHPARAQARADGLKRFIGDPCVHGHAGERLVSNGSCWPCQVARCAKWKADHREKHIEVSRASYARHIEKRRIEVKAYKALYVPLVDLVEIPPLHSLPKSRREAVTVGSRWYFTGIPCRHGHVTHRFTYASECSRCNCITNNDAGRLAKYRRNHPEKTREIRATRRARELGSIGQFTAKDVLALFEVQKGKCAHSWCRKSIKRRRYHIDHVIPLSKGGENDRRNIQLLCPPCNLSKRAKHPIDFAQQHGRLL